MFLQLGIFSYPSSLELDDTSWTWSKDEFTQPVVKQDSVGEDALKVATAALSAAEDAANTASVAGRGKIE
ncbi:hypothetical protein QVD17_40517 [Tagetes erecta]|uniref:Uncharacterized protein n=1 Tax=Tagetes erecta TaxID=13708 RepID=A0AAD8NHV9_TARER|nr:hypothetical protein QVD17_40517 [Tagetes erecta]